VPESAFFGHFIERKPRVTSGKFLQYEQSWKYWDEPTFGLRERDREDEFLLFVSVFFKESLDTPLSFFIF
jgi:hypothetical protein